MPKIVAVVGGKHSGKTTIIQNVIPKLASQGYRVGTIKEMVRVPTLDKPGTETTMYTQAGAKIVVAVPRQETVIFIKNRLTLNEILPFLSNSDYVLVEGFESEKCLPKIIAAKNIDEIQEFSDGLAIAISGLIVESKDKNENACKLGIPLLSSINESEKIAEIIEKKAFAKLPELHHCSECGYKSCYDLAKAIVQGEAKSQDCLTLSKNDITIAVNGIKVPLKEFPKKIIWNMLKGMISSMDDVKEIKRIKIEAEINQE